MKKNSLLRILCVCLSVLILTGCGDGAKKESSDIDILHGIPISDEESTEESKTESTAADDSTADSSVESSTPAPSVTPSQTPQTPESKVPESEPASSDVTTGEYTCTSALTVYSISGDKYLRTVELTDGDLAKLGEDEYYSFSMIFENTGSAPLKWDTACVSVDGGDYWYWASGEIRPGGRADFHIAYTNMKGRLFEGEHLVSWHIDGEPIHHEIFYLTDSKVTDTGFTIPSRDEIMAHNAQMTTLAPYIYGWFSIPMQVTYSEYSIDFNAGHLPNATYCCLGNWTMDQSSLYQKYQSVRTEYAGVHGYAGFQKLNDGTKVAIMSFWDVYCKDETGKEITIRAKRVYPETTDASESFGGEGTGAHCIVPYDWEEDHWYRMHLICRTSAETGNTVVDMWAGDMETEEFTLLCSYDLGYTTSGFQGQIAMFLEDYLPDFAGEVRSMEVRNAQYFSTVSNRWLPITECYMGPNGGLPKYEGSYDFGSTEDRFWMITSGVGGDWYGNGMGKKAAYYTVEVDEFLY